MKRFLLLVTLLITLFSCNVNSIIKEEQSITDNNGRAVIIGDSNAKMFAGYGVDPVTKLSKAKAIEGEYYYSTEGSESSLSVDYIESNSKLTEILSKTVVINASGSFKSFSAGIENATWTNDSTTIIDDNSVIIYAKLDYTLNTYGINKERMKPEAKAVLESSIKDFEKDYGLFFKKASYVNANLVYMFKYTFNQRDIDKKETYKGKIKAEVASIFDSTINVDFTAQEKAFINSLSKQIYITTNVSNYPTKTVQNFEEWRKEEDRFNTFVYDKNNIIYLQSGKDVLVPYSDVVGVPREYSSKLALALNYTEWKELWLNEKDHLTTIKNLTNNSRLSDLCIAGINLCEKEMAKIDNYSTASRQPTDNEFKEIHNLYENTTTNQTVYFNMWDNTIGTGVYSGKYVQHLADIDGDGRADLIQFSTVDNKGWISYANLDGTFDLWDNTIRTGGYRGKYIQHFADINGDGRADLIQFSTVDNKGWISYANQDGTFDLWDNTIRTGGYRGKYVQHLADIDGDGRADLIQFSTVDNKGWISYANQDGTFDLWDNTIRTGGYRGKYVQHLADIDGDGRADLIQFSTIDNKGWISYANQDGTFDLWDNTIRTGGYRGKYVQHLADINGDGRADLIQFSTVDNKGWISYANIDGTFDLWDGNIGTGVYNGKYVQHLADVTGDGRADLIQFSTKYNRGWISYSKIILK